MNQINPMKLLQLKGEWDRFTARHPRFPAFLKTIMTNPPQAGTVLEITVTGPDGRKLESNLKLQEEDIRMISELKDLMSR